MLKHLRHWSHNRCHQWVHQENVSNKHEITLTNNNQPINFICVCMCMCLPVIVCPLSTIIARQNHHYLNNNKIDTTTQYHNYTEIQSNQFTFGHSHLFSHHHQSCRQPIWILQWFFLTNYVEKDEKFFFFASVMNLLFLTIIKSLSQYLFSFNL